MDVFNGDDESLPLEIDFPLEWDEWPDDVFCKTLCCGDPFDFVPLPVESWLGRLEFDCLVLDRPRVAVFAGLAFVVRTEPELPPLRLGDEFAEFFPFCV